MPIDLDLVMVRWLDSTSPKLGWIPLAEWDGVGSLECVSVGFVIERNERAITLAPHVAYPDDPEQRQGNGIITIPLPVIVSQTRLLITSSSACAAKDHFSGHPLSEPPSS